MPDSVTLLRLSRTDPASFGEFYRRHFRGILAFHTRGSWDAEVAVDLTAETFAQAFASRKRFYGNTQEQAEAWLFRIARRQLTRYLRRGTLERTAIKRLGIQVPEVDAERRERIEQLADLGQVREVLRHELAALPPGQQEALRLRVLDELPYAVVAERLEISEQAARLRVSRALRALGEALQPNPTIKELRG